MLSDRARLATPSPTQQVTAEADRLRRAGIDVIDLGAGEPNFATPDHVKAAGTAAIAENWSTYTPNTGILELRQAICDRYRADYDVAFDPTNVIVSAGGKQALFNVALALYDTGDEVVTHAPGWPTIIDQIRLCDATPVVVRTHAEDGFALSAAPIQAALSARTKAIVLNSPGNPTGALVAEAELATIADIAQARGIWVVLDLCYEQLIFDDVPHALPRVLHARLPDRFVVIGSLSKRYAMTGWRGGWAIGPRSLIGACDVVQGHSTSNASSITQRAGLAALTGPQACVDRMRDAYRARRDLMHRRLTTDPRIRCHVPAGAFYLFPDISELLSPDGLRTSTAFARALLQEAHVAVTPGEAFDAPGFLRISCAAGIEQLEQGADRFQEFVDALGRRATPALQG